MDIINTSLEALIQRATNVQNQSPDNAAIEAFSGLVNKEPGCARNATQYILTRAQSSNQWEALQALMVLDNCMKKCGSTFLEEVGKFRFLNELIKLVSPKYLGAQTAEPVKRRVLDLMSQWTVAHPTEAKIRDAYEMLRKQQLIKDDGVVASAAPTGVTVAPTPATETKSQSNALCLDEREAIHLRRLLQSKDPEAVKFANRFIKSIVQEEECRMEARRKDRLEIDTVMNNCRLLKEMLESYASGPGSAQDLELIKELHATCQAKQPNLLALVTSSIEPTFASEVGCVYDEVSEVLSRYSLLMSGTPSASSDTLLDLASPSQPHNPPSLGMDLIGGASSLLSECQPSVPKLTSSLDEILTLASTPDAPDVFPSTNLNNVKKSVQPPPKARGFEELDFLGESLLKESLTSGQKFTKKSLNKVPMNQLFNGCDGLLGDVGMLNAEPSVTAASAGSTTEPTPVASPPLDTTPAEPAEPPDEPLLMLPVDPPLPDPPPHQEPLPQSHPPLTATLQPPPLSDIKLSLADIKPSVVPGYQALSDPQGVSLLITLAADRPRPDVSVFVVTATSTSQLPVSSLLFQPVVPKFCRLRLLAASATSLPGYNPFLPPAAITQIMLIASPNKDPIHLKFVVSYTKEDETVTEMGEIERLLLAE